MRAERLVIDTNVWIAALVSPTGAARRTVDAVLDRGIETLMSEGTFAELVSRLERPKFDPYREPEAWDAFLAELVELASWHDDAGTAAGVSRDADDDKFLALAVVGRADAIVSGDRDLLELVAHEGVPIVSPAEFLRRLDESAPPEG